MQPPRNVVSTVAWRKTHVGSVPSVCLRRLFVQERNKVYGAGYTGVVKCGKLYSNLYAGGPGVWAPDPEWDFLVERVYIQITSKWVVSSTLMANN